MKKSLKYTILGTMLSCMVAPMVSCKNGTSSNGLNPAIEDISNENGSAYYEIFVHEFADTNGDGIGDLKGVTDRLPYLKKLGVKGIWLMPIMPSHTYHKYDCDDYYSIDKDYGTMADFDELIEEAKKNNIDVIIDLVLNHTSKNHAWFKASEADYRDNNTDDDSKKEYYVWRDKSKTGYSKSYVADAYYEANFDSGMPELNMDNPLVREEISKVAKFWLDKGCKGFRLDAAKYYYYDNVSKNVEFLKWFKAECLKVKEDAYIVGEVFTTSPSTVIEYAESGISFFNFSMSETSTSGWGGSARYTMANSLANNMTYYYDRLSKVNGGQGIEDAPFISNHDQDRSGGYLKDNYAKLAASNYLLAKGHPFIYYGEEIGLRGKRPANTNTDADRRLAMIWTETNDKLRCKDPVGATYNSNPDNVQVTKGAMDNIDNKSSLTYLYRKVLSIRNKYNDLFQKGNYESLYNEDDAMVLKITYGGETIYKVTNFTEKSLKVTLSDKNLQMVDEIRVTKGSPSYSNGKLSIGGYNTVILK